MIWIPGGSQAAGDKKIAGENGMFSPAIFLSDKGRWHCGEGSFSPPPTPPLFEKSEVCLLPLTAIRRKYSTGE